MGEANPPCAIDEEKGGEVRRCEGFVSRVSRVVGEGEGVRGSIEKRLGCGALIPEC